MHLLRQFGRRKVRTALTVFGITIGIWSLVVFSAMANKIDSLVSGGSAYYAGKIIVSGTAAGGYGALPMRLSDVDKVAAVPGVDVAVPQVLLFTETDVRVSFGVPSQTIGQVAGADRGRETVHVGLAQGRDLSAADEGADVVVLGTDLASKLHAGIGDAIELHGVPFTVVGILAPTLTTPDNNAFVPLRAAQQLVYDDLPDVVRSAVRPEELASQVIVYPAPGVVAAELADRIEASVPQTTTLTGDEFDRQVGASVSILNAILVGVALISLVVGGLSVINTMAMSVAERTREIGVKRAIGSPRLRIIRELVVEAGVIGLVGGLIGLAFGVLVVVLADEAGRSSGTVLFEMRPSTAVFAVAFATILGVVAGVVPAINAARLDPVDALRYE